MGRFLTIALIAIGAVGLGLVVWISLNDEPPPAAQAQVVPLPAPVVVLVAAGSLRAGNLMKPADMAEKSFASDHVPLGAIESTPQSRGALFGAMIRRSLATDQTITAVDVMRAGDHGFLAAVLRPGMRAMTLGTDVIASEIDLVWPGDHVDLILTQQADPGKPVAASRRVFGDTVLTDVRVLAVDQQLVEGASSDQPIPKASRSVTVEVTPEQVARLAVAIRLGKLAFAVRSASDTSVKTAADSVTVWAGDVAPGLGSDPAPPPPRRVMHVWQGTADGKEFQF